MNRYYLNFISFNKSVYEKFPLLFIYLKNYLFCYTYQSKFPLHPRSHSLYIPSHPTPIQFSERVRYIALGIIQGPPYYI